MKSLELFTGAGGLALGAHQAGFEHVALLELNKHACETLRRNARDEALPGVGGWNVVEGDIKDFDFSTIGSVDMIAGGVPCQPFSLGGKHLGMNDERNMFPDFVRAVRAIRPRAFIVENVKGLTRPSFRNYFQYILLQLAHPGAPRREGETWEEHLGRLERIHTRGDDGLEYNVVHRVLNAADFGVPQTRERVFIVGFRADVGLGWRFPRATHSRGALLRDQSPFGTYWERHGLEPPPPSGKASPSQAASEILLGDELPWRTIRDAISDLPEPRAGVESLLVANHRLNPGARAYPGHTGSPIDLPSKTLKAGVHGVPGGENMIVFPDGSLRYLTVREAARVQTFPDGWRFEGSWSEAMRQLGNAVPVDLAAVVARSVAERLRQG